MREIQERPVRPLTEFMQPLESFPTKGSGQRLRTTGHYAEGQRLVVGRLMHDEPVTWVVDRFVVEETGANLAVVRGWIPKGATPPEPPEGTIELLGSLAPPEAPSTGSDPSDGTMTSVDVSRLVNQWPGRMYNGFVFALEEGGVPGPPNLERVPPPLPATELKMRNVMYAGQWWLFSAFALWMWVKMVRQAHRSEEHDAAPAAETKENVA